MNDSEIEKRIQTAKNEILTILRQQKDRKRDTLISGTIIVNPALLSVNTSVIMGPYVFNTLFTGVPIVTFGQVNHTNTLDTVIKTSPQSTLFLVVPYIAKWTWSKGSVDGFYLGLYALMAPPVTLKKHTVMWQAQGKASQNKNQHIRSAWTHSYNNTAASHLIQETTNVDQA